MVSLNGRNDFIADWRSAPSTNFAYSLVFGKSCEALEATTIGDRAARAVATNDKDSFVSAINELNRRKIKPESDWVLDDFLLFALITGARKFQVGKELCNAIISERRPTNALESALHGAFRGISQNAYAIEGEFSFVKLVFCDITGQLRIDSNIAQTVYAELTNSELFAKLENFPKLLAYRAFDLLVLHGIENKLDSTDAIVSAIESRAEKMSLRDWFKVVIAMRPSVWVWIICGLFTACSACFAAGFWFASLTESSQINPQESSKQSNLIETTVERSPVIIGNGET